MAGTAKGARQGTTTQVTAVALVRRLAEDASWAESFDTLATGILVQRGRQPHQTLLVTSTQPGEGKTTVAATLALALARSGQRVVLVDGDLRRPSLHRIFAASGSRGLAHLLDGRAELADVLQRLELESDGSLLQLSLIAAGRDEGGAIVRIERERVEKLLEALGEQADAVVVDSPPVLSVNDALLLAPLVGGTLFVVASGAVRRRDAERARQRIQSAGGNLIGVVLNGIEEAALGYHPYAYAAQPER